MDNIENIVLFLFILFSIISSIMKKKKQAEAKAKKDTRNTPKRPGITDILLDYTKEALPKEAMPKAKVPSEVDAYFLEAKKEERKLNEIDKAEIRQAKIAAESFSTYQKPVLIKPKETRFDITYDQAENELNLKNKNLHKIRKLLCEPKSLRDYILMKEILDKPKALQEF